MHFLAVRVFLSDLYIIESISGFFISLAIGGTLTFFILYGFRENRGIKRVINNCMIAIFVLLMAFRVFGVGVSLVVWYKLLPFREFRHELNCLSPQIGDYFRANEKMPDKHELADMLSVTSVSSGVVSGFRVLTNNACAFVISNHYVEVLVYTGSNYVTAERVELDGEGNVDHSIRRAYKKAVAKSWRPVDVDPEIRGQEQPTRL
ncbi:hypothetical protein ACFLQR_01710 [Verrucomicrobiota bacterium]